MELWRWKTTGIQRKGCEPSDMSMEDSSRGCKIELRLKTWDTFTQEGTVEKWQRKKQPDKKGLEIKTWREGNLKEDFRVSRICSVLNASWAFFTEWSLNHTWCQSVEDSADSMLLSSYFKALRKISDFFFSFIFIIWRLITLQYCRGFCHTLTWISHGFTCVPHPDPPSRLPPHPIHF